MSSDKKAEKISQELRMINYETEFGTYLPVGGAAFYRGIELYMADNDSDRYEQLLDEQMEARKDHPFYSLDAEEQCIIMETGSDPVRNKNEEKLKNYVLEIISNDYSVADILKELIIKQAKMQENKAARRINRLEDEVYVTLEPIEEPEETFQADPVVSREEMITSFFEQRGIF